MSYHEQRAELAAMLGQLQSFARTGEDRRELESLRSKLSTDELNLVVLGQFKRGKSSLINALVGEPILPTALLPLTAVVTEIGYGAERAAWVEFRDGREQRIAIDQLAEYVTEAGNPLNHKGVARVRVQVPSPYLHDGLRLVDTPGIGSTYVHNTAVAREFVPSADTAIFVLSIDPPIGALELNFLSEVTRFARHLLIVINKIDLYPPEVVEESIAFTRRTISELPGEISIYPISALRALAAKQTGDVSLLADSGLLALEQALTASIVAERDALMIAAVAGGLRRHVSDLSRQRRLELVALDEPLASLDRRLTIFRSRIEDLRQERDEQRGVLQYAAERIRSEVLETSLARLRQQLNSLVTDLHQYAETLGNRSGTELARELERWTNEAIGATVVEWLVRSEDELNGSVARAVARQAAEIARAAEEIRRLAVELFQVAEPQEPSIVDAPIRERFHVHFQDQPVGIELASMWLRTHVPRALARRWILREAETRLLELADRQVGTLRYQLNGWLEAQIAERRDRLDRQLDELIRSVEAGITAGMAARERGERAIGTERERLRQELDQLGEFAARLEQLTVGPAPAAVDEPVDRERLGSHGDG